MKININKAATLRALSILRDKMNAADREIMKQAIAVVECMTTEESDVGHIQDSKEEQPLKWKVLDECSNSGVYCPVCNKKVFKINFSNTMKWKDFKYCPHCGSRVDGEVWL